jgi:ribokinase
MKDIITFGAASWDIFLGEAESCVVQNGAESSKNICFSLGSKVEIKDIYFSTGGGGTNTAVGFAVQGFKTAYCGKVGKDIAGSEVIKDLKKFKVDCSLISKTDKKPTNHSVIINVSSEGDRTILVYRGASDFLSAEEIPWKKIKSKWFYVAPFSVKSIETIEAIADFAKKNNIKIAFNPSISQIIENPHFIYRIIKKIDVLILNQEEASSLVKIPYSEEGEIFQKIDEICDGVAVMTKGSKGATVSDGRFVYAASAPEVGIVDKTGAGDSFASGFISNFMRTSGDIEKSLALGIANSISCIQDIGAKTGLLSQKAGLGNMDIEIKKQKL